ncbi:MAG: ATP-binding protein [Cyanobacteria bacterium P01_E01_bin.42]
MQLTSEGKKLIEEALTDRKWSLHDLFKNCELSIDTIKRFNAQQSVSRKSFVILCEILEIDWRIASEQVNSTTNLENNSTHFQNPFTQRGMLENIEELYGRDRELRQVFEFLNSRASVALVGETGMGTSSLLWAIAKKAPERLRDRQPIYLNMREILDLEDYYETLAARLGIEAQPRSRFKKEFRQKRVLLLLDEVEQLRENWFNDGVRRELRAWANGGDRSPLRLVVAAHRPLEELFEDSGLASPFANICQEFPLLPWDGETVRRFIGDRLAGTGIQFTETEIEAIASQSGGVPLKMVQLCYDCYERYRD